MIEKKYQVFIKLNVYLIIKSILGLLLIFIKDGRTINGILIKTDTIPFIYKIVGTNMVNLILNLKFY